MSVKRKTKKSQKYTLNEFKTWLDGYCSAHPDNWSPTADQWKLISEKLFSIVEDEIPINTYAAPPVQQYAPPVQFGPDVLHSMQPTQANINLNFDPQKHAGKEFFKNEHDTKSEFI